MIKPIANLLFLLALVAVPYLLLGLVPALKDKTSLRGCIGLAILFCFTGIGHFIITEPMSQMIPPAVPHRIGIIYASGVFEVLVGLALLPRATRVMAGWIVIVMLLLLLPSNIYAAIRRVPLGGHELGPIYLLIRVPVQLILMAWSYWFAVRLGRG